MSEPRAASVPSVFVCRSVSPSPRVPLRFPLFKRPLNYNYSETKKKQQQQHRVRPMAAISYLEIEKERVRHSLRSIAP